jgi:hypothetical protein
MSLKPLETKKKRISMIKTGVHLVMISDLFYLKGADGKPIANTTGQLTMAVQFKNDKNEVHEQHYLLDGDWRQEQFNKMLNAAQLNTNEQLKKKDAVGKRLWIAIKEIHFVNDDVVVMEDDKPKIDYYIFRTCPFIENGRKPAIVGDPADADGYASGAFLDYKNVSQSGEVRIQESSVEPEVKPEPVAKKEEPVFNGDVPSFAAPEPNLSEVKPKPIAESKEEPKDFDWNEIPEF